MHTPLKITVESLDHEDGTENFIVETHGGSRGTGNRCVCASPENAKAAITKAVDDWREHNATLAEAASGKQIETRGVVGE